MLSIDEQIHRRALVCPHTHALLSREGDSLVTADGAIRYPIIRGVPLLLDPQRQRKYLDEMDGRMLQQYSVDRPRRTLGSVADSLLARIGDRRTFASLDALARVVGWQPPSALCLSIGGGPGRSHPQLVNLNIDLFPNVDVVADAYSLPYADGSVDTIHCEAVLEHLEEPDRAVREMYRVLAPEGQLYAATPFLAAFHAYPNHFQNFTLIGHRRLFERAGFHVTSAGVCVGPTFAITELLAEYIRALAPGSRPVRGIAKLLALALAPLRALDDCVSPRSHSFIVASSTYVHARKPTGA